MSDLDRPRISFDTGFLYSLSCHFLLKTMNAPLFPEVLRRLGDSPQGDLPLASEGVVRYVWENRFGEMLIEVVDGVVYVNGDRIEPAMAEGGMAQALG